MRNPVLSRLLSLPLRVKVLTAVGLACVVALLVGIVGLVQLGELQQRSRQIQSDALVPSTQIAEVRRAFLQTRIDALADELLPKTGAEDTAHKAYLADIEAMDAAVKEYAGSGLTAAPARGRAATLGRLEAVQDAGQRPLSRGGPSRRHGHLHEDACRNRLAGVEVAR